MIYKDFLNQKIPVNFLQMVSQIVNPHCKSVRLWERISELPEFSVRMQRFDSIYIPQNYMAAFISRDSLPQIFCLGAGIHLKPFAKNASKPLKPNHHSNKRQGLKLIQGNNFTIIQVLVLPDIFGVQDVCQV